MTFSPPSMADFAGSHYACFQLTDDDNPVAYISYPPAEETTPPSSPSQQRRPPPTAEALFLRNALAVPSSPSSYFMASFDDFGVDDSADMYSAEEPPSPPQRQPQTSRSMYPKMAATFDFIDFVPFDPYPDQPGSDGGDGGDDTTITTTTTNAAAGRQSISSSARTHASYASYDTMATTVATRTPPNDDDDQSPFSASCTRLPSIGAEASIDEEEEEEEEEIEDDSDDDDLPPLLPLLHNPDGTLGTHGLTDTTMSDQQTNLADALQWTDVAPPAALLELPALADMDADMAPELLRAILQSSVESIAGQVPGLKAAVAAWQDEQRRGAGEESEATAVAEAETETADKGKGKEKETLADSIATLRPPPPAPAPTTATTTATAPPKRSKLQIVASKLRRLRGSSSMGNGNGESSSQGAAAAAAAAAAIQRHNEMMAGRHPTPGFKWVRRDHGANWELVPEDDADAVAVAAAVASANELGAASTSSKNWNKTMLLAMVQKDVDKKRGGISPRTVECISCFEDTPANQAVQTVCHAYCLDCFGRLVATAVAHEAQFPPKCCLNEIPASTVHQYAPHDVARAYAAKAAEVAVPLADRVYCPVVDCGVFVPPNQVTTAAAAAAATAAAVRTARCRNGHETCTACRQPAHSGDGTNEACPEASAQDRRDLELADALAEQEGWRRCIACAVLVEHRDACQHMTCRCGAQFCYVCGLRWRTCDCSMSDLRARKDAAADRRRVQQERDEQAARERQAIDDAVREVEAYERRVRSQRAAMRARQLQRLHALHHERAAALRTATASKYDVLRACLAGFTAAQRQLACQVRRSERAAQRDAHARERAALAHTHDAERAVAVSAAAAAVAEAEASWAADYRARLRLERRLEAAYAACSTPAALTAYQKLNDERLDVYLRWRDRELAHARFAVEEARDVRVEVLGSLARTHRRTQRAEARALARKHRAERAWCVLVAAERERLLAEAEAVEQGLGLAASPSETDAELLRLLQLEEDGQLDVGDDESRHYNEVMLSNMVGQMMDALEDGDFAYDDVDDCHDASAIPVVV